MKSFALSLAFILRFTATRKWPNHFQVFSFDKQDLLQLWLQSMVFNLVVKPNQRFPKNRINKSEFDMFHQTKRGAGYSCGLVSFLIGGEKGATLF